MNLLYLKPTIFCVFWTCLFLWDRMLVEKIRALCVTGGFAAKTAGYSPLVSDPTNRQNQARNCCVDWRSSRNIAVECAPRPDLAQVT